MSEGLKRVFDESERRLAESMQEMHERGDIRHLHGKPLRLEEDDPAWLVARMLKEEGFSHPFLERRGEVQRELAAVDGVIERLRRRRADLCARRPVASVDAARGFNDGRRITLDEYRDLLIQANRSIRDYNLYVPDALHVMPIRIDRHMERIESSVPPLELDAFRPPPARRRWWSRLPLRGSSADPAP